MKRNDDLRDVQSTAEICGMQSARTAETDEGEIPRIVTAFDGNQSYRLFHVAVDGIDNTLSQSDRGPPAPRAGHPMNSGLTALSRESNGATENNPRGKASQQHVRVSHRQAFPAFVIADRTRLGSCAGGSNF